MTPRHKDRVQTPKRRTTVQGYLRTVLIALAAGGLHIRNLERQAPFVLKSSRAQVEIKIAWILPKIVGRATGLDVTIVFEGLSDSATIRLSRKVGDDAWQVEVTPARGFGMGTPAPRVWWDLKRFAPWIEGVILPQTLTSIEVVKTLGRVARHMSGKML